MTSSGRRRRARLRALLVVLIVALPLGVFLWGRSSSAFAVQRIELSGARRVSAAKAAETLRAQFLGHNLFGVRAAQVAAALRSFPYFAHVEIDRDFPNTLRVRIVEYRPAAVLFSAGRWYIVSREGRVLLRLPGVVARPAPAAAAVAQGSADSGQGAGNGGSASATATTTATSAGGTAAATTDASGGTAAGVGTGSATTPASAAVDSSATAASAGAANDAAALAASLSSAALGAPTHVPSLFAGDLTAEILAAATPPRQARRLPVLVTRKRVKVGDIVADRSVRDALAVLAALPRGLRARVLFVTVAPAGIDVVLRNGVTFAFGDARDRVNKVLALRAVLAAYQRRGLRATWVDVSVPNRPLGTPVIVSRAAQVQSARPAPLPAPKTKKASPAPTASGSPTTGTSASPAPTPATASASPRPAGTATPKPSATPPPTP